ncbi:carbohydrate sulfotransferase 11-like [Diadema antillarum]|uniref:carbohydrate sulfotransferase 11-like n=1 Tax=Diadema antillarum TaxID=105358 RepID=UPI003A85FCCC
MTNRLVDVVCRRGVKTRQKATTVLIVVVACVLLVIRSHGNLGSSEHDNIETLDIDRHAGYGPVSRPPASLREHSVTSQSATMQSRVSRLRRKCERLMKTSDHNDPAANPPRELIVDEKYRLIYCNVPKVGCTNWKAVFLKLAGINDLHLRAINRLPTNTRGKIYLNYLHKYTNVSHRRFMLQNFTKFLFVRHPFSRILSAFRNKLAPNISIPFTLNRHQDVDWISTYGLYIINKYRGTEAGNRIEANWRTEYDLKFSEFVQYLTDNDDAIVNPHWMPIDTMCRPCDIEYDIVGKFETLNADAEYILQMAHVDPKVKYPQQGAKRTTNSSSADVLQSYYSDISPIQIFKLHEIFRRDFELFDYSCNLVGSKC